MSVKSDETTMSEVSDSTDDNKELKDRKDFTLAGLGLGVGASVIDQKKVKAPNKKRMEDELEQLQAEIKKKEAEYKSLQAAADEAVQPSMKEIRTEKVAAIERRKRTTTDLQTVNKDITKQMDAISRLESSLPYKKEEMINSAIRKLENQLKYNNFRLIEEKKIVSEIDSLKRSKKVLSQYLILKKGIDDMRDRQRKMRHERDVYYKAESGLKLREVEVRKKSTHFKTQLAQLKKEIDDLYVEKRKIVNDFKQQEKEFLDARDINRKKVREEQQRKKEEERKIEIEIYQQEMAAYAASVAPYEEEIQLCSTLITYLQRLSTSNDEESTSSPESPNANSSGKKQSKSKDDSKEEGWYVLKRKDEYLFCGVGPRKKKRERRRSLLHKPVGHSPSILQQFSSLNLSAPSNTGEIQSSLTSLNAKKVYFSSLTTPRLQVSSSNQTPSIVESLIGESIPSTPEVQLDGQPPIFPSRSSPKSDQEEAPSICRDTSRRLSSDSGACELEGPSNCDIDDQTNNTNVDTNLTAKLQIKGGELLKYSAKNSQQLQLECNSAGHESDRITYADIDKSSSDMNTEGSQHLGTALSSND